jgi:uncharacterized membrane protein
MHVTHTIETISSGFELAGVAIIVFGAVAAGVLYVRAVIQHAPTRYRAFRQNLGHAILVGLEVLVAADIIRTVAIDTTFESVGVLGLLVLVRTFLSWSLEVEIHGTWPWQRAQASDDEGARVLTPGAATTATVGEEALLHNKDNATKVM